MYLARMVRDKSNKEYWRLTKLLQEHPAYGYFSFIGVNEDTLEKNRCHVRCLRCGRKFLHYDIESIIDRKIDRCDVCLEILQEKKALENIESILGQYKITENNCILKTVGYFIENDRLYLRLMNFGLQDIVTVPFSVWNDTSEYYLGAECLNSQGLHYIIVGVGRTGRGTVFSVRFDDGIEVRVYKSVYTSKGVLHPGIGKDGIGVYGGYSLTGFAYRVGRRVFYRYIRDGHEDIISSYDISGFCGKTYVLSNEIGVEESTGKKGIYYKFAMLCAQCGKFSVKSRRVLYSSSVRRMGMGEIIPIDLINKYGFLVCAGCNLSLSTKGKEKPNKKYNNMEKVNKEGFKYKVLNSVNPGENREDNKGKGYYYVQFEDGTVQIVAYVNMMNGTFSKHKEPAVGEVFYDIYGLEYSVVEAYKDKDSYTIKCAENNELIYDVAKHQIYSDCVSPNRNARSLLKGKLVMGLNGDKYAITSVRSVKNFSVRNTYSGLELTIDVRDTKIINYLSGRSLVCEAVVGGRVVSYSGFEGFVIGSYLVGSAVWFTVQFRDGSTMDVRHASIARGHFYPVSIKKCSGKGNSGYSGTYRGIHSRGGSFTDVYYDCYKNDTELREVLRPKDIDARFS